MIDREQLRAKIQSHVDGFLTLENLAAWAEEVFRGEDFEARHAEQNRRGVIRDPGRRRPAPVPLGRTGLRGADRRAERLAAARELPQAPLGLEFRLNRLDLVEDGRARRSTDGAPALY